MFIDTKPSTTPHPTTTPGRRRGRHLGRVLNPRRQGHGSTVVRVRFSPYSRLYAYRANGQASVGDSVRVDSPLSGPVVLTVEALGRGGYMGPLKSCEVVR